MQTPLLKRIFGLAFTIAISLALLGADGDRSRFNDVGHRMMCMCGCNQILLECNHVGCTYSDKMRGQLMAAIDHGDNDDSILQSFVQEYGTTVLAAPTTQGFDRVAWIMPFAVFFAGTFVAVALIRNWKEREVLAPAGHSQAGLDVYRDQARRETEL